MRPRAYLLALASLVLAGCSGQQSALDPAGPSAALVHRLGLGMWVVAALVTILVVALAVAPFLMRIQRRIAPRTFLVGGGVVLPAVAIIGLIAYSGNIGAEMRRAVAPNAVSVTITGHMYWWDVRYSRPGLSAAATANELRIPVGEPVEIRLESADVIHSFWVPSLAGKTDMIPGQTNRMVLQADRPGRFRGQCAEFCGLQHALMAFWVTAVPREDFDVWLAGLARPVLPPTDPEQRRGQELFVSLGCGQCHAVRGVSEGRLGPDLTTIGARHMVGAGALAQGVGNLAAWTINAQHFKPGAAMPAYDQLRGADVRAIAVYLGSLQ